MKDSKQKSIERANKMIAQYSDMAIEFQHSDPKAAELATQRALDWIRYLPSNM